MNKIGQKWPLRTARCYEFKVLTHYGSSDVPGHEHYHVHVHDACACSPLAWPGLLVGLAAHCTLSEGHCTLQVGHCAPSAGLHVQALSQAGLLQDIACNNKILIQSLKNVIAWLITFLLAHLEQKLNQSLKTSIWTSLDITDILMWVMISLPKPELPQHYRK